MSRQEWAAIIRRWWLIALCACLGVAIAYAYLHVRPAKFHASTFVRTELVLSAKSYDTTQPAMLNAINTEATQAISDAVLQKVSLRVPGTNAQQLKAMLKVTPVVSSQLLEIDAAANSATLAATIANADAYALIEYQTASDQSTNKLREQPLLQQISTTQGQIDAISKELAALQTTSATSSNPEVLSAQLRTVKVRLSTATDTYTRQQKALIQLQSDEAEHATYLSLTQPAKPANARSTPDPIKVFGLGGISGLALGICITILLGLPNGRVRTVADAARSLGASSLVSVRLSDHTTRYTDVATSASIEGFRALWISLVTTGTGELGKLLLVTGEREHSGTSLFAVDLGRHWAAEGKPVLIVDANLDRPSIGSRVGIADDQGLSQAIGRMAKGPVDIADYVVPTRSPRLWVLPAGDSAPTQDANTLMQSLARVLDQLRFMDFAVIIVNVSPITSGNIAALLAERVDGVVVVARKAAARLRNLQRIHTALQPSLAPTLALIVNEGGRDTGAHAVNRREGGR